MMVTTRLRSSPVIWVPLPQPPLPYAFYYRFALCPLLLALFRKRVAYASASLRGVGSTLRGVVPYGTESSRRPDGARFNVFFLQGQTNRLPVSTELSPPYGKRQDAKPDTLCTQGELGSGWGKGIIRENQQTLILKIF